MLHMPAVVWFLVLCCTATWGYYINLEIGDPCGTSYRSSCRPAETCLTLEAHARSGQQIQNCGFTIQGEKICCPLETDMQELRFDGETTRRTTTTTTTARPESSSSTALPTTRPAWLSLFKTNVEYLQSNATDSLELQESSTTITTTARPQSSSTAAVPTTLPETNSTELQESSTLRSQHADKTVAYSSTTPSIQTGQSGFVYPGRSVLPNGSPCYAPVYEGQCLPISQCSTLDKLFAEQRLSSHDIKTCHQGVREEIICCPLNVPIVPRRDDTASTATRLGETNGTATPAQDMSASISNASALLPYYTHLAALAYFNDDYDGYVHRCTAVVLTPQLLLTAASCAPDSLKRPQHAVFGVADLLDKDEEENYIASFTTNTNHRNDLALLQLQQPLKLHAQPGNVSLASICTLYEHTRLLSKGDLRVSAWAKSESTECALFEQHMRLLPANSCAKTLLQDSSVQELGSTHICLTPKLPITNPAAAACRQCLANVGSILHLVRDDGTRCVLGVATPTNSNCNANSMYYTSLLSTQFQQFMQQTIESQQQQQQ